MLNLVHSLVFRIVLVRFYRQNMLKLIQTVLLVFFFLFAVGQKEIEDKIDSVKNELFNKNISDSLRVELYYDIFDYYYNLNADSSFFFLDKSIDLANRLNNKYLILKTKGTRTQEDLLKGNFERAMSESIELERVAVGLKFLEDSASQVIVRGQLNWYQGHIKEADSILSKLVVRLDRDKRKSIIHKALTARVYRMHINNQLGNFDLSVKIGVEALNIYDSNLPNEYSVGNIYQGIANAYENIDGEKFLYYIRKTLKAFIEEGVQMGTAAAYGSLGNYYKNKQVFDSAFIYMNKGLVIFEEYNNIGQIILSHTNIAQVHIKSENYSQAKYHAYKVIELSKSINYAEGVLGGYEKLGNIFCENLEFDSAIHYYTLAVKQGKQNTIYLYGLYHNLAYSYAKVDNYKSAYVYQSKYMSLKDSMFNQEKNKQIAEMEAKYQNEKILREKNELAQQNEIVALESKQKGYWIFGLIGALILIGVLSFVIYQQNRIKNQQQTAQLEQKLLRTQMNPHFMSNAMMSIQTFMFENNTQEATKYLGKFGRLTRQMLNASRSDYIPLNEEISFIHHYLDFQQLMFPEKLNYKVKIDKSVEDEEETLIPPMLSQPFIENAIEHGIRHLKDRKGELLVLFRQEGSKLILELQDNGIGRTQAHEINLKARSQHISHSTTITQERIELLKRKYNKVVTFNITDLEIGTKVKFELPLMYS